MAYAPKSFFFSTLHNYVPAASTTTEPSGRRHGPTKTFSPALETWIFGPASIRRSFHLVAALRSVASILQESLPCTSLHALRRHRLRSAPSAERA